jgi:diguanylate cyclase (GGDEF)-like protein
LGLDWGKLPDIGAIALLTCAFASVARRGFTAVSGLWLTGWLLIELHFTAFLFDNEPGWVGVAASFIGLAALAWAGIIFMWSCVPYRGRMSNRVMGGILLGTNTLYLALLLFPPTVKWPLVTASILMGALPAGLALLTMRRFSHPLRWSVASLYSGLMAFLLAVQNQPGNGPDMALNAVLFTIFFGCSIHFLHSYRHATTGALITIAGFLSWATVFVLGPGISTFFPNLHPENEVWNLPKYVVAVGMILLLLEKQIEHNKYLALHDELTGLPNRRLFQDRLAGAIERAHRTRRQAALLLVDLDHFKQVNDTVGHHIGDMLLKRVGEVFLARVRRSDTVARTGGDEFSIVLEEPISRDDAESVGRSLIQLLNEPFEIDGYVVCVGASVGIALYPEDATTGEALCIAADRLMYSEKNATRGDRNDIAGAFAGTMPIVRKQANLPPVTLQPH